MSALSAPRRLAAPALIVVVVMVALLQLALMLVFAWSASRAAPSNLPMAIAGPPQAVTGVTSGIEANQPGAFDFTVVADDAAAQDAVTSRQSYGAVVLIQSGVTVYTAPAASSTVAQALATAIPAAVTQVNPAAEVVVTPLVPSPPDDPNGQGFPIALIPLAITSIAAGAAIGLLARSRAGRLVALAVYAGTAGVFSAWALQSVLGVLTGSWIANAATMALACAAIAAGTAGLTSLLGRVGVVLSATVIFFLGFPFSGATSAWQLVPTPWGQYAQYLPIGAANTAVRSVAFFGGAGATGALSVLAAWAIVGVLLAVLFRVRGAAVPAPVEI